jgi:hypothetical protein
MNQFDWIEEDQQQPQQDGKPTTQQQQQQRPQEQQRPSLTKKQHCNNSDQAQRQTIANLVSASFNSMTLSTPDHAMTQSEDFIQAMDSQGDLKVDADKITDLARPSSVLGSISAHTITTSTITATTITGSSTIGANATDTDEFGGMGLASQEAGIATGKEEAMLWVMDAAPTPDVMIVTQMDEASELLLDDSTPFLSEKPKKKAHRSKRGGRNQREKQLKQQFVVGHDDDGPMYLEDLSDEEDEDRLAMEDYLQVKQRSSALSLSIQLRL